MHHPDFVKQQMATKDIPISPILMYTYRGSVYKHDLEWNLTSIVVNLRFLQFFKKLFSIKFTSMVGMKILLHLKFALYT